MRKFHIRIPWRDVLFLLLGAAIGYGTAIYFYNLTKKDLKQQVLDRAFMDCQVATLKQNYPQLYDSTEYLGSGTPWSKLTMTGIDMLYFNIEIFRDYNKFDEFTEIVNQAKLAIDGFNDRMTLRNFYIVIGPLFKIPDLAISQYPRIYSYYQRSIRSQVSTLQNYLKLHRAELVQ